MTQPLTLGCDCLGEIHYVDAVMATSRASRGSCPTPSACTRRTPASGGSTSTSAPGRHEVRRSRRLVISHIATVGNYEYGFFWYLYLDGTIQLEVKLTGILSTAGRRRRRRSDAVRQPDRRPGVAAPVHQHLFCARLDLDVDGTDEPGRGGRGRGRCRPGRTTRGATPSGPVATVLATRVGGAARHRRPRRAGRGGSRTRA